MTVRPSRHLDSLSGYPFFEINRMVARLRRDGIAVIDFGVGDPKVPTPAVVRDALKSGADLHAAAGYPSYIGSDRLRHAVAAWMHRRFDVTLSPDDEISITIGSKEAVFNFPHAFLDPGDVVLAPNPGYPPYRTGTLFAGGSLHPYLLPRQNGFLPRLEDIPSDVLARARILWINYPNSPTGRVAPPEFLAQAVHFAARHDLILASDEAYSEIYYQDRPHSVLEFGRAGIVVFQSLSKRSFMTGYRVGWICGDAAIVSLFKKLKTNIDSGCPDFIQDAAVAALADESHVQQARTDYAAKRNVLLSAMAALGLDAVPPEGTIFLWQRVPDSFTDVEFAKTLLRPDIAIAVMPGSWLATPAPDGTNPGTGFVRWALCPSLDEVKLAAERLSRL